MSADLRETLEKNTMVSAPELVRDRGDGVLQCFACGHRCKIPEGRSGVCRVRFNRGGQLMAPSGYVAGIQVDPIEKKPFFHAFPGRDALSFGMMGCNLHCSYCQNWLSSQALRNNHSLPPSQPVSADQIVRFAVDEGVPVIVSTYNEPLITADWAVEIFKRAKPHGITCGFVSNGNGTREVLEYLRPHMDLYKIDLKSFDDKHYRQLGGTLQSVLDSIAQAKELGFWVEIVTLVIPGFNDSDEELKEMARFIAGVSPDIPWHVTAFHPDYQMQDTGPTPASTLNRAYAIGRDQGLRYVYAGNLPGRVDDHENTCCPGCGKVLIQRRGFQTKACELRNGKCPDCDAAIPGVWEAEGPSRPGSGIPRAVRI